MRESRVPGSRWRSRTRARQGTLLPVSCPPPLPTSPRGLALRLVAMREPWTPSNAAVGTAAGLTLVLLSRARKGAR
eukprot:9014824-Lingulodinium_polyedra.AAC.1